MRFKTRLLIFLLTFFVECKIEALLAHRKKSVEKLVKLLVHSNKNVCKSYRKNCNYYRKFANIRPADRFANISKM